MRRLFALSLLAVGLSPAILQAQVRMGGTGMAFHPQPVIGTHGHVNFTIGSSHRVFRNRVFPNAFFLGEPWLADYPDVGGRESPQVIVVQQPAAVAAAKSTEEPRPVTPLLIELQGDHYVRYSDAGAASGSRARADYVAEVRADGRGKSERNGSVAELPASVLVYRDGRREEAGNYAIFGGSIYINSNYWTSGAWTRKIQLADLDLPSTLQLNQERGVKFVLPAGPNEVVTRP